MDEAELLKKLREAFATEAQERLTSLSARLMSLEKGISDADRAQDLEVAFREAHSLKGAARAVNLSEIETLCQAVEGVFAAMKRHEIQASPDLFDLLHRCIGFIEGFLATPEADRPGRTAEVPLLAALLNEARTGKPGAIRGDGKGQGSGPARAAGASPLNTVSEPLKRAAPTREPPPEPQPEPMPLPQGHARAAAAPKTSAPESIRVSVAKLDALFLKAEELVSLKLAYRQHLADLKEILHAVEAWSRKWDEMEGSRRALRKMAEKDGFLAQLVQFLEWNRDAVQSMDAGLQSLAKDCEQKGRAMGLMVDDLLEDVKRVTMLPFSTLLDIFPRMVREISRDLGKDVDLIMKGTRIEIDRRILEEMRDPLTHILRNAVDHGVESPDERRKRGKPQTGTIQLSISQTEAGKIEIVISDDGGGIDVEQVKKKALALGMVAKDELETLEERDALSFVFRSGVSTSPIITDLSGRGLGMAIVQEKVEKLGGRLLLDTALGRGTSIKMELPATIATFRGIQVRAGGRTFMIPSSGVERTLRIRRDQILTVENRETAPIDGKVLALADLAGVLGIGGGKVSSKDRDRVTLAVLCAGDRRIGFRVDEVLGEQEVLVKGLGPQLRRVPFISGATILGSGQVVPILNVTELLNAPLEARARSSELDTVGRETKRRSILVAEDSITSRMLLKSILEGAGYEVRTTVDGAEAFATLKTGEFDLVVSDVEMPRMDGFELTRKIRSDKRYGDIPVVLVTGLETREDREKGIDAGANAYIVKSSFDQSNLLEVIRRMI